jgi:hypothetical protein
LLQAGRGIASAILEGREQTLVENLDLVLIGGLDEIGHAMSIALNDRLSGARLMHGLDGKKPPLYAVGATMNLGTESGDLAKMIEDIEAQGVNPGFVAVDTLSASLGGGDENGPGMAMFIANCQRLAQ